MSNNNAALIKRISELESALTEINQFTRGWTDERGYWIHQKTRRALNAMLSAKEIETLIATTATNDLIRWLPYKSPDNDIQMVWNLITEAASRMTTTPEVLAYVRDLPDKDMDKLASTITKNAKEAFNARRK